MNIPAAIARQAVNLTPNQDGSFSAAERPGLVDQGASRVFAFGDPEPILASRIADYLGVFVDTMYGYYLPPISLMGLANLEHANAHHGPIMRFKANMVTRWLRPSAMLSPTTLQRAALDYQVFGNAYFQVIYNRFGRVLRLDHRPALRMRAGVEPGVFFEVPNWRGLAWKPTEFLPGEIIHIKEYDVKQGIYGIPSWYGGMQAILLSEAITLFRRRWLQNGAHMGYVFVTNADLDDDTAQALEKQILSSKGLGNGRNLYVNVGSKGRDIREPVKIIPVGDIGTKDDFAAIKAVSLKEALAMHRMQPGIAGCIPENMTGFGDLEKVMRVYCELEVPPLQQPWLELNQYLPAAGQIGFDTPVWQTVA
jgi:PBSX family phage portal protein